MSIPESRMGRKIEKRPHDGGGSVTCSIMAWFPLFSLSLSHSLMATKHWSLWYRFKLEPFFCPSKLSDVREGLGFGRGGNEVISGRFQIVSLLYSCNRCKIDPTMHKRGDIIPHEFRIWLWRLNFQKYSWATLYLIVGRRIWRMNSAQFLRQKLKIRQMTIFTILIWPNQCNFTSFSRFFGKQ